MIESNYAPWTFIETLEIESSVQESCQPGWLTVLWRKSRSQAV